LFDALHAHAIEHDTAIIVPTFTYQCEDPAAWYEPVISPELLPEYQARTTTFDPATTPVSPDLGFMPEYVRRQAGSHRSNHPVLSFAATGPRASEAVCGQGLDYPLGPNSPLGWLCNNHGVVLMVGTDLTAMTIIHLAETIAPVSYVQATRRHVRSQAGWIWYWGAPACSNGFSKVSTAGILDEVTLSIGWVGMAETRVVDAGPLVQAILVRLRGDPAWLLCDNPACPPCTLARQYLAGKIDDQTGGNSRGNRESADVTAAGCPALIWRS